MCIRDSPSTAALVRYAMQHGLLPADAEPPADWEETTRPRELR